MSDSRQNGSSRCGGIRRQLPPSPGSAASIAATEPTMAHLRPMAPTMTEPLRLAKRVVALAQCSPREAEQYIEARSEEHTSEIQSLRRHSYAVVCLKQTNRTLHLSHAYS